MNNKQSYKSKVVTKGIILVGLLLLLLLVVNKTNAQVTATMNIPSKLNLADLKPVINSASSTKADLSTVTSTVTVAGKEFIGGLSKSGSTWIVRTSKKSGNKYKAYLGTKSKVLNKYINAYVWTNKDQTKAWYYTINSKTGFPKKNKLQ